MKWDHSDIEIMAAGEPYNVSFTRSVGGDGAEWGVEKVTVFEHEGGERPLSAYPLRVRSAILTAIDDWCEKHKLSPGDLHGAL